MYQPDLYIQNKDLQRGDVDKVMHNFFKLIKWSESGTEMVVDLGCGCGDVTKNVILAKAPKIKGIVGVDVSFEMFEFARRKNAHKKIEYKQLNLGTTNLEPTFKNQFDHAFSFHVFHWIKDQRRLFNNIYDMLKPGGDVLGFFAVSTDLMLIYKKQATMPKWSKYLHGIDNIYPYQYCKHPQDAIEDMLKRSGFSHVVKLEKREFTYSSPKHLKSSLAAIDPFLKNIPKELHEDYMNDFVDIGSELKVIFKRVRQNQIAGIHRYIIAVVYLRKPCF